MSSSIPACCTDRGTCPFPTHHLLPMGLHNLCCWEGFTHPFVSHLPLDHTRHMSAEPCRPGMRPQQTPARHGPYIKQDPTLLGVVC